MAMSMAGPAPSAERAPGWLRKPESVLRVIEWILETIALAALAAMAIFTTVNAVARYFFASPIPGSLNMILLYLMPPIVFLALGRVQAANAHIAATLFVDRMRPGTQRICRIIVTLVILGCVMMMTWGSIQELMHMWGRSLGGMPELPVGPSWLFIPVGLAAITLRALWQLAGLTLTRADIGKPQDIEVPDEIGADK
ncbi:TRAP transporter small permease [Corynebacterium glyciniphilum]|uniref:TRAP transporter small permease n=1 Tax=Corynebacterium glyciniphilum TaxID=1404244 RepID=UPI003DA09CD7